MLERSLVAVMVCSAVAGCGGASTADVSPEPMPSGATFTGVYHSPQYGELHIVQHGDDAVGEYQKDERSGKLQGTVEGNLFRFEFVEERALVANKPNVTRGRGYFRYVIDPATDEHVLVGEWGIDENEVGGGKWRAVKSPKREPQLQSETSGGETTDEDVGGFGDEDLGLGEEEEEEETDEGGDALGGDLF